VPQTAAGSRRTPPLQHDPAAGMHPRFESTVGGPTIGAFHPQHDRCWRSAGVFACPSSASPTSISPASAC
jgi:hypothetical protein